MSVTDEIAGIAVDTKVRLCQVWPMADIDYPLIHVVDVTGVHHALVLAYQAGTVANARDIADRVAASLPGVEPAVVAVVTEGYARPRVGGATAPDPGGLRDDYERVAGSDVTAALVLAVVTCTNVRTVRLLPYSWDDGGQPVWHDPCQIGTVAADVVPLLELASMVAGVAQ